ncbi:MAG: hypothetical protein RL189_883 [Pseudomonadota bacterium]|jgi:predicted AAA+ superfamily ATPase
MYRLSLDQIEAWKRHPRRKPLLLRGARQVGKTWLVREHAKSYAQFIEVNLEERPHLIRAFVQNYGNPEALIRILEVEFNQKIDLKEALLFFDEIQICKEAILALRYFKEKVPHVHVIAAGSLLEFAISEISFPVGRVDFQYLFPMNFFEFLVALNYQDLAAQISNLKNIESIDEHSHELLNSLLGDYFLTGGMPDILNEYILSNRSLAAASLAKQNLLTNIREDFYKYASRAKLEYVRKVFDSIPANLGKKIKFTNIDRESKSRDLLAAANLLRDAGIINIVYHTSANGIPLSAECDFSKFKAYLHDIGLCLKLMNVGKQEWQSLINKGEIAEQFVAQELLSYTPAAAIPELFYWHRESKGASAEVDLVAGISGQVTPIEVKSGANLTSKSLGVFLSEKPSVKCGYKFSPQRFRQVGKITLLPLYATAALFKVSGT